jgi:ketosteroid isomerase-like protein
MAADEAALFIDRVRAVLLDGADPSTLGELCHEDVTYENPSDAIETGVLSGREAFCAGWASMLASFRYEKLELLRQAEAGDHVAYAVELGTVGRESGVAVDQRFSGLLLLEDGLIRRYQWSFDPEWAFDELARFSQ